MSILRAVKGMNDLFEEELSTWRMLEQKTREHFALYGFGEVRTPILEELDLFVRGVGEGTDIVEKEMYVLEDRDGKRLCLRPENTAAVVRAFVENRKFSPDTELKAYYIGPMFRRERPQKGRLRQFHQIGAEVFGIADPVVDIEVMVMLHDLCALLGLKNLKLAINTLGQPEERISYASALRDYFSQFQDQLCEDCKRRLIKNALRILDCKQPHCATLREKAPAIADFLRQDSLAHFEKVKAGLSEASVQFEVMPRLVRGLDYYTRTVFEVLAETGLGAQNAVAAGGRYDGLVESLGGPSTPAFGFSAGIERIALLLQEQQTHGPEKSGPDITLVFADQIGERTARKLVTDLRREKIAADVDYRTRSVKAQMRRADRICAKMVMVIGEREASQMRADMKLMATGEAKSANLVANDIISMLATFGVRTP